MKKIARHLLLACGLLGASAASQAAFITIDNAVPVSGTIDIVASNDFRANLAGLGVTSYTLGSSLGVDGPGTVTYYYYGKEAGYENVFSAGALSYASGYTPTAQNYFSSPILIGSVLVDAGVLDFQFCAFSSPTRSEGCITNLQNDLLGIASPQSIALNVSDYTAWLFWDDSGAGPDDNHDDMLIKAVFTPTSVPEPGTLALFGVGLLGLGLAKRARARKG